MQNSPELIVQKQVEAYNARDLEAFVATYTPNIQMYTLPDNELILSGHAALRQFYAEHRFNQVNLACAVTDRMVLGNFVIYAEQITGLPNDQDFEAVAIYEVEGGLIRRVWFIRG